MPKLRLKRTPAEEEEERAQRKARKAQRKETKPLGQKYESHGSSSTSTRDDHHRSKRRATGSREDASHDTDYESDDRLEWLEEKERRKKEEEEFQQRLWDELGHQERLDNLTSNLNSYPHIPHRWKSSGMADLEDVVYSDPNLMDDEHYAEWMREGMWKKRNAQAYQEQLKKTAEEEARLKLADQLASKRARWEAREADERRRRKRSRERRAKQNARSDYDTRWDILLSTGETAGQPLTFQDIPWPCQIAYSSSDGRKFSLDDLTTESISEFLFSSEMERSESAQRVKTIRGTLLRFHPDKFDGRIISRVPEAERAMVREGVGIVVRTMNELLKTAK
ncbi:hypothetical protein BJ322DRAFT_1092228 [Thelephora terrestris]|uniref:NF-kappa-B inhibitor-like protein 1 n=1 Tax=Thelephora terrestris TaxID=56493 RepID=A0A9P6H3N1_9AGAM|nr:hypothetical protein BJ322DRAFT_1092228 [Thelephora terrestris]